MVIRLEQERIYHSRRKREAKNSVSGNIWQHFVGRNRIRSGDRRWAGHNVTFLPAAAYAVAWRWLMTIIPAREISSRAMLG